MVRVNDMQKCISEILLGYELSLLDANQRKSDLICTLFDDSYIEIGSSGRSYNKKDTILSLKHENINFKYVMDDYSCEQLNEDIALIHYIAIKKVSDSEQVIRSFRTSIWKRSGNNWKLYFHQGTKIKR
jgi:hypothetical protein